MIKKKTKKKKEIRYIDFTMLYIAYLSNYYDNSYSIMLILILPENFMLLYIFRSLYRRYLY